MGTEILTKFFTQDTVQLEPLLNRKRKTNEMDDVQGCGYERHGERSIWSYHLDVEESQKAHPAFFDIDNESEVRSVGSLSNLAEKLDTVDKS
ncbi:hypothetical protein RCL_jg3932.t1 [Rhizophagus clarus]|uniref:Uncharacterized protein n=1 Tax=Rhizophagus clarus TaxID=94130 RepID=A0A8H3QBS7_9GLOM|nr:hypothetical protein RCL_jg3932.t1 [Rhizophagus clarus]